jgi:hypothetical protein
MECLPDVPRYGQAGGNPWKREKRLYLDDIPRTKIIYGELHSGLAKRLHIVPAVFSLTPRTGYD